MAQRALTPGNAAYCSECGADTPPDARSCARCGATFEGNMDAVLCPICNSINPAGTAECAKCSAKFPEAGSIVVDASGDRESSSEEEYLRNILRLSREKARSRQGQGAASARAAGQEPASFTESDLEGADLEGALWKLAEPFDKMLERRRHRLEQMDALIERARKRIAVLSEAANPIEIREREELKRQIEELLLEKEDILKLEEGLVDLENTYRNILRMQQDELKARETSLRARVEAFRNELEAREQAFGKMREREGDMVRREDEFRRLMNRIHEREKEMDKREELLREKTRLLDERHHTLSEAEVDLERRRWALEQKASSTAPPQAETALVLKAADQDLGDLKSRVTELEEQMERLADEKAKLVAAHEDLLAFRDTVRTVFKDLDDLLGQLPDDKIRTFARSDRFRQYEKILDALEL